MRRMRALIIVVSGLWLTACGNLSAVRLPAPPKSAVMEIGPLTSAPFGYVEFCTRHQNDCRSAYQRPQKVTLTAERWFTLQQTNWLINAQIAPITDAEHYDMVEYWTYPDTQGDCEDYALAKRKALIAQGWPAQNLLLGVAIEASGSAHAVLIVTTDHGDYVLDNQTPDILPWQATDYRWAKRQSQRNPNVWVSLETNHQRVVTASSGKHIRD